MDRLRSAFGCLSGAFATMAIASALHLRGPVPGFVVYLDALAVVLGVGGGLLLLLALLMGERSWSLRLAVGVAAAGVVVSWALWSALPTLRVPILSGAVMLAVVLAAWASPVARVVAFAGGALLVAGDLAESTRQTAPYGVPLSVVWMGGALLAALALRLRMGAPAEPDAAAV